MYFTHTDIVLIHIDAPYNRKSNAIGFSSSPVSLLGNRIVMGEPTELFNFYAHLQVNNIRICVHTTAHRWTRTKRE